MNERLNWLWTLETLSDDFGILLHLFHGLFDPWKASQTCLRPFLMSYNPCWGIWEFSDIVKTITHLFETSPDIFEISQFEMLSDYLTLSWHFFFLSFSCLCRAACEILASQPEIEPGPCQWEHGVLTTGPPGGMPLPDYFLILNCLRHSPVYLKPILTSLRLFPSIYHISSYVWHRSWSIWDSSCLWDPSWWM